MFEKVNPSHPDKVADRIAGAIVDLAYSKNENPRVAVEVLLGHGNAMVTLETSVPITDEEVAGVVNRIAPGIETIKVVSAQQDAHLAENQSNGFRCGDNGIFKGMPVTEEQANLKAIAEAIYSAYPTDGKYILANDRLIICQSNAEDDALRSLYPHARINPLGPWTGGSDVDSGATNRKLGSDMGDSVTGGGLHGKDLSKADVSVNIYCFVWAQRIGRPVYAFCAIGDEFVDVEINSRRIQVAYSEIVRFARQYIDDIGGFENFAEWGLI